MHTSSLCARLHAEPAVERLCRLFSQQYSLDKIHDTTKALRQIKRFMHDNKSEVLSISRGYPFDSSDCLSLAVRAHLIAGNLGFLTHVARPAELKKYFHAVLVYGENEIFEIAGSGKDIYRQVMPMGDAEIVARLKYIRQVVNAVHYIRGKR